MVKSGKFFLAKINASILKIIIIQEIRNTPQDLYRCDLTINKEVCF